MKTIKTNFKENQMLILTEGSGRIVALVPVDKDEQDITARVLQAIAEDQATECIECVTVLNGTYVDATDTIHIFKVKVMDDLEDNYPTEYDYELETGIIY